MTTLLRHILLPAPMPALFFLIAATPVEVLGCRNRGLLAIAITFLALGGAAAAIYRVPKVVRTSNPLHPLFRKGE